MGEKRPTNQEKAMKSKLRKETSNDNKDSLTFSAQVSQHVDRLKVTVGSGAAYGVSWSLDQNCTGLISVFCVHALPELQLISLDLDFLNRGQEEAERYLFKLTSNMLLINHTVPAKPQALN